MSGIWLNANSSAAVRDHLLVRHFTSGMKLFTVGKAAYILSFLHRYTNLDGGYDRNPYNCELSEVSARDFDRYRDMVDDRDYELFTRSQFSSCTQGLSGKCQLIVTFERDKYRMHINRRHQIAWCSSNNDIMQKGGTEGKSQHLRFIPSNTL